MTDEAANTFAHHVLMSRAMTVIRATAWLAVLLVVTLSIIPGNWRPHVLGNGRYEHFVAYFITAGLFATGYPRLVQVLASWAMLTICAGVLEFVQLSIPGRFASFDDFAAGTIGACIGLVVGFVSYRVCCSMILVPSCK